MQSAAASGALCQMQTSLCAQNVLQCKVHSAFKSPGWELTIKEAFVPGAGICKDPWLECDVSSQFNCMLSDTIL